MHLAGKTNTGDVFTREIRRAERFADGDASGTPPVCRLLFSPANLWRSKRLMIFRGGRDEAAALIDYNSACSASADVNPEYVDKSLLENFNSEKIENIIYGQGKMAREGDV
jgi:hypothetical protein